jgi:hypothetical protein
MAPRAVFLLFLAANLAMAQNSASADVILQRAETQAAQSQRIVWVLFHASW